MPGAVLRVEMKTLDADFIKSLTFTPDSIWQQGQSKGISGRPDRSFESSGFACNVSDICEVVQEELAPQIEDTLRFMSQNEASLEALAESPLVEERSLNLGISLRIDGTETVVQGKWYQ